MGALGVTTAPGVDPGVHLRWSFQTALGFPPHGFDLYRRPHLEWNPRCVPISGLALTRPRYFVHDRVRIASNSNMTVVSSFGPNAAPAIVVGAAARIVVTSRRALREFITTSVHSSGQVRVRAYDGSVLVASATVETTGRPKTIRIAADRFRRVVIEAPARAGFYQICWLLVADGAESAGVTWQHLGHFELPADWVEASSRIPTSLHPRYAPDYLDFPFLYHKRPLWDIVVIGLSIGGMALTVTTLVTMWRRLMQHARRIRKSVVSLFSRGSLRAPVP